MQNHPVLPRQGSRWQQCASFFFIYFLFLYRKKYNKISKQNRKIVVNALHVVFSVVSLGTKYGCKDSPNEISTNICFQRTRETNNNIVLYAFSFLLSFAPSLAQILLLFQKPFFFTPHFTVSSVDFDPTDSSSHTREEK